MIPIDNHLNQITIICIRKWATAIFEVQIKNKLPNHEQTVFRCVIHHNVFCNKIVKTFYLIFFYFAHCDVDNIPNTNKQH